MERNWSFRPHFLPRRVRQDLNVIARRDLRKGHLVKAGMLRYPNLDLFLLVPLDDTVAQSQRVVNRVVYRVLAVALREGDVVDVIRGLFGHRLVALLNGLVFNHLVTAQNDAQDRR